MIRLFKGEMHLKIITELKTTEIGVYTRKVHTLSKHGKADLNGIHVCYRPKLLTVTVSIMIYYT
jgi:hypothetical protein